MEIKKLFPTWATNRAEAVNRKTYVDLYNHMRDIMPRHDTVGAF